MSVILPEIIIFLYSGKVFVRIQLQSQNAKTSLYSGKVCSGEMLWPSHLNLLATNSCHTNIHSGTRNCSCKIWREFWKIWKIWLQRCQSLQPQTSPQDVSWICLPLRCCIADSPKIRSGQGLEWGSFLNVLLVKSVSQSNSLRYINAQYLGTSVHRMERDWDWTVCATVTSRDGPNFMSEQRCCWGCLLCDGITMAQRSECKPFIQFECCLSVLASACDQKVTRCADVYVFEIESCNWWCHASCNTLSHLHCLFIYLFWICCSMSFRTETDCTPSSLWEAKEFSRHSARSPFSSTVRNSKSAESGSLRNMHASEETCDETRTIGAGAQKSVGDPENIGDWKCRSEHLRWVREAIEIWSMSRLQEHTTRLHSHNQKLNSNCHNGTKFLYHTD